MLDYNAITSLVSIVGVTIALAALALETRRERLALQVDILMKLQDKWECFDMLKSREAAAKRLLASELVNYELGDVLEFLAVIGFLYERKAIDTDLAYKEFSYWMIRYWLCAQSYVEQERRIDPQSWLTLEHIVEVMKKRELKEGYPPYTQDLLHAFLEEEARMPPTMFKSKGRAGRA